LLLAGEVSKLLTEIQLPNIRYKWRINFIFWNSSFMEPMLP
jgi:hypothetical protein